MLGHGLSRPNAASLLRPPMRRSGPRRDTAEIAFQQQKPLQEAKGPLETDLPVSPSGCDLIDLGVCCVAGNFKRPVLPMPASPLLWSAGSVASWHLVLSKAPSRPSAALSMHAVFDSNPRLCGEQEGGGDHGRRVPQSGMHKTWGNQTALWCCDCGRYDGTAVSVGGPGQGGFRVNSGRRTADAGRLDCRPGPCERTEGAVWSLENVAGGRTLPRVGARGDRPAFPRSGSTHGTPNPTAAGRCPHRRPRCCRGLEMTRPCTNPRQKSREGDGDGVAT